MSSATCHSGGRETGGSLGLQGQPGWLGEGPGQTLSKNKNTTKKIKKKKKTNPEPFNGGGRGYGAVVLGQEQSFGPEMRVASTDQGLHCDFFSSLGMVRLVAEAFSFEISGMVR